VPRGSVNRLPHSSTNRLSARKRRAAGVDRGPTAPRCEARSSRRLVSVSDRHDGHLANRCGVELKALPALQSRRAYDLDLNQTVSNVAHAVDGLGAKTCVASVLVDYESVHVIESVHVNGYRRLVWLG
jgi:hypothetical protein